LTFRKISRGILMRSIKKVSIIPIEPYLVTDLKRMQQKRLKVTFVDDDDDESSVSL
jgi:hypothetical protein